MRWTREVKPFVEKVRNRQPEALAIIKKHGVVFDDLEDRWQKLAFTLYTDIVELSRDAEHILEIAQEPEEARDE